MDASLKPPSPRPWRDLLGDDTRTRGPVVAVGIALVVSVLVPLAGPLLVRAFVDGAIAGRSLHSLTVIAGAYLAVATTTQVAAITTTYLASTLSWSFTNRLRERLAAHALGLDMGFHARYTAGEMIERVDGDMVGLGEFLSQFAVQAASGGLLVVGTVVLVTWTNVWAGLSLFALIGGGAFAVARSQRWVVPQAAAQREATARQFGVLEEEILAAEDLRANGAGPHGVARFLTAAGRLYRADVNWAKTGGVVMAGTNLLFALGTAVMVGVGVILYAQGAVTIGTVVLLFQYAQMIRQPIEAIVGQAKQLQQAGAAVSRVTELLGRRTTIVEAASPRPLAPGPLSVHLDQVTFAYPGGEAVLHDIDLRLEAGRSIGLVGRTGSGKSTIGRLISRLYDPTAGAVRLGGVDLRDASLSDLRSRVRMVTQDVQLFSASVRDNVTLFDANPSDGEVVDALAGIGLGRWLHRLPDGLDTLIGPGGMGLSAGEAQLLAFARTFLADPDVVILDEATSRLDAATEALVARATDRLLAGRTALVIAHRLSSLDRVEDIAVLHHGRVLEHGPRQALRDDPASHFAGLLRTAGLAP